MTLSNELSASAQRVQVALHQYGLECKVIEMPAATRTAKEAAQAVGCRVEQIVKSIVFKTSLTGKAILVVASGPNRINEKTLSETVGEPIEKADADFVRRKTGFAIGGVSPVGHVEPLDIFIDQDLLQYDEIWAAAGTPHAVFKLTPADLQTITAGRVVSIK
jgi:prolyl-tRNA editing enzyme YbaK/EbsC (Cys-tRNA(Pro) deacylase)